VFRIAAGEDDNDARADIRSIPLPDTARQSTHRRQVRLVISVDDGLGGRLHPLQRLLAVP